jgi:hypothetical protein
MTDSTGKDDIPTSSDKTTLTHILTDNCCRRSIHFSLLLSSQQIINTLALLFPFVAAQVSNCSTQVGSTKGKESKTTQLDRTQVIVIYNNVHGEHLPHYNNYNSNIFSKISYKRSIYITGKLQA